MSWVSKSCKKGLSCRAQIRLLQKVNDIAAEKKLEKSRRLLFVYLTSNIFFCIIPSSVGSLRKAYMWWFTERGLAFKEESYLRLLGKCLYCTWSTHGAQSAYNLLLHQTVTWSTRALNKGNLLLAKSSRRPNVFRAREMSFYFLLSEKFLFFFCSGHPTQVESEGLIFFWNREYEVPL